MLDPGSSQVIRARRQARGMTLAGLTELVDLSQPFLSQIAPVTAE